MLAQGSLLERCSELTDLKAVLESQLRGTAARTYMVGYGFQKRELLMKRHFVRGRHAAVLLVQVSANHVKSFCGSAPDSPPGGVQLDLECASTWTSTVLPPDFSCYQSAHPRRPAQGCTGDHTRCFQSCLPEGADSCPVWTTQPSEQQQSP